MTVKKDNSAPRSTYRHGDLPLALLNAGIELARAGGPGAVTLREATRQVGVVPNAAYRHYASQQELLQAVRSAALALLARAIEAELAKIPKSGKGRDPSTAARASLRAVGTGYMEFAQDEPGLFRTAFSVPDVLKGLPVPEKAGSSGLNPFQLLAAALDRFVDAGLLSAKQRLGADYLAWSAVHGLALLIIDGPLRAMSRAQTRVVGQRLLDMVEKGIL
jgi:AcrR family transcriptional regulator